MYFSTNLPTELSNIYIIYPIQEIIQNCNVYHCHILMYFYLSKLVLILNSFSSRMSGYLANETRYPA